MTIFTGSSETVVGDTLSSQCLASAVEKHEQDTDRCNRKSTAIAGLCPKSWSCSTPLGGLAREVAAWPGYVINSADHERDAQGD